MEQHTHDIPPDERLCEGVLKFWCLAIGPVPALQETCKLRVNNERELNLRVALPSHVEYIRFVRDRQYRSRCMATMFRQLM